MYQNLNNLVINHSGDARAKLIYGDKVGAVAHISFLLGILATLSETFTEVSAIYAEVNRLNIDVPNTQLVALLDSLEDRLFASIKDVEQGN